MNPNSDTLFHFTKKISVFKNILKNGLRYSFAFESFPKSIIQNVMFGGIFPLSLDKDDNLEQGFAMPMISFCDIPLMRVNNHSKRYGKFAIGISKDYLCHFYKNFINPVFYADSPAITESLNSLSLTHGIALKSFISQLANSNDENVKKVYEAILANPKKMAEQIKLLPLNLQNMFNDTCDIQYSINTIVSLIKPTYGLNVKGEYQCFYDEREWRIIQANYPNSPFEIKLCYSRDEFNSKCKEFNNALNQEKDAFVTIPGQWFNMINQIIVPKEKDVINITNFIRQSNILLGYDDFTEDERLHLMTKITSFERIANDY